MNWLLKINKVEPSAFSSSKVLAELIRDTEEMYAAHFGETGVPHLCKIADVRTGT